MRKEIRVLWIIFKGRGRLKFKKKAANNLRVMFKIKPIGPVERWNTAQGISRGTALKYILE